MVNSGDTGFVLICAAFVFFMTPGLALFYGGLGRRKNVVNTMLSSLFLVGVSIVLWVLVGYSLSFSGNIGWRSPSALTLSLIGRHWRIVVIHFILEKGRRMPG